MTTATILLAPAHRMHEFFFTPARTAVPLAQQMYNDFEYDPVCNIDVPFTGEDAAEAMFDLTNNPGRQAERERVYGEGRSISSGDVVIVDGVPYLCCSAGWAVLEDGTARAASVFDDEELMSLPNEAWQLWLKR